jgi:plastocyanin
MTARIILAALASLATLACGSDGGNPTDGGPDGDITVSNNAFTPAAFSVAASGTVTWAWNSGGVQHNVTFDDGENSATQGSGTYQRTFTAAGSYPYHCTIHGAAMSGTISVTAAGSGTGGGGGGGGTGGGYGDGM